VLIMTCRSFVALAFAAIMAIACSPSVGKDLKPVEGDSFLGPADAKVVLIEFFAPTCPACKSWHDKNWEQLKTSYIDTGKIKFVFRELPSHNPPVDASIFAIARCAGAERYSEVIDQAFVRQEAIELASRSVEGPRPALADLAKTFGLSAAQFESCIRDPANVDRIFAVQQDAQARRVGGTPTIFVNDREVPNPTFEALAREIETALTAP
jgi:protein-disulfide isomerase